MAKTPIERLLDTADWQPMPGLDPTDYRGTPYATHSGVLDIGGIKLRCYRLSNGQAVFAEEDLAAFFGSTAEEFRQVLQAFSGVAHE